MSRWSVVGQVATAAPFDDRVLLAAAGRWRCPVAAVSLALPGASGRAAGPHVHPPRAASRRRHGQPRPACPSAGRQGRSAVRVGLSVHLARVWPAGRVRRERVVVHRRVRTGRVCGRQPPGRARAAVRRPEVGDVAAREHRPRGAQILVGGDVPEWTTAARQRGRCVGRWARPGWGWPAGAEGRGATPTTRPAPSRTHLPCRTA